MPIGIGAAAILGGGSLLSGLISGNAATSAADTQAAAARQASQTQLQEFNQLQANLLPFLNTGIQANNQLYSMFGGGSTSPFSSPLGVSPENALGRPPTLGKLPAYNFRAPTAGQASRTPGYQFELHQALNAAQNSGAAHGGAFSGDTMQALQSTAQGLASTDYWNTYNAAAQNYANQYNSRVNNDLLKFNAGNQNYWNLFNADVNQQGNITNLLQSLAGRGTGAAISQGQLGGQTAAQVGANQIGAGNAIAAGQVGSANALSGGLNSILTQLAGPSNAQSNSLLAALLQGGGGGVDLSGSGVPGGF